MRIKYKGPDQIFFRRFWRVIPSSVNVQSDGTTTALNARGKRIRIPWTFVTIVVGGR